MVRYRLLSMAFLLAVVFRVSAQTTNNQVWAEYMLNYPFANSWNVELAAVYSTVVEEPHWQALDFQLTPEYALSPHIDLMGAVLYNRTVQNQSVTSSEFREMLGTRINMTPHSRVLTRLLLRFEQRNMYYQETDTRQWSTRTRLRFETITPLNRKTMFEGDNLWYLLADAEVFIVHDQQVDERFANRYRIRLGTGYRLSYTWRFEFVYTLQESRNTIGGDYDTTDNLFRFRVKHFLNKSKPSTVQGNGN
jgi:hypothetical protein